MLEDDFCDFVPDDPSCVKEEPEPEKSETQSCENIDDCGGRDPGYPFYYDPGYMPKQLHTMTKIAGANAIIVPFVYVQETYDVSSYSEGFVLENATLTDRQDALMMATAAHLGLWGTSFTLNLLGMTKGFKIIFAPIAALWIEHMLSNFSLLVTLGVTYLFFQANFSYGSIAYYLLQGLVMWQLERAQGMPAIKHLRPNYPYLDGTLKSSFFYLIGINKHTDSYPFMETEWPEEEEN